MGRTEGYLEGLKLNDMADTSRSHEPERFFKPWENSSGCSSGSCIVSRISAFTLAKPPTSSQDTLGILGAPILSAYEMRALFKAISRSLELSIVPALCRLKASHPLEKMKLIVEIFDLWVRSTCLASLFSYRHASLARQGRPYQTRLMLLFELQSLSMTRPVPIPCCVLMNEK